MQIAIEQMISTGQAAQLLGYKQVTLRRWRLEKKHLVAYKVGGRWRYNLHDVQEFLKNGRREIIT
jgi:excisionase family DNA binding protein